MAYTIISQNNSTTTLSDGVNTITVPSRVNLTSGNFTIVEVNNNMATLEDGDGNVYRDIPCVATLVDAGGGGGAVSSVNGQTGAVVLNAEDVAATPQYSTMPVADSTNVGEIVQFTGATDANYTHGYFYECVETQTQAASAVGTQTAGTGLTNIQVDVATWEEGTGMTEDGSLTMHYFGDGWNLSPNAVGVTFDGTPVADDEITVVYTAGTTSCSWERVDVQPAGSSLPDQTGKSGEFLTTDGTDASWTNYRNRPFTNTATKYDCLGIQTSATITDGGEHNILIGSGISTNPRNGRTGNGYAVAIGGNGATVKVGAHGVAIGAQANFNGGTLTGYDLDNCVAVGFNSYTRDQYSTAIGASAGAKGFGSIQLGYGENTNARTLSVGFVTSTSPWAAVNYELLSSDGTIPTARLTKVNSTVTLTSAGWSGGSQTVTVTGMTATGVVLVSPDPTDQSAYTSAGIICTTQAANSLTFTCSTTPTADIDVNVVML